MEDGKLAIAVPHSYRSKGEIEVKIYPEIRKTYGSLTYVVPSFVGDISDILANFLHCHSDFGVAMEDDRR